MPPAARTRPPIASSQRSSTAVRGVRPGRVGGVVVVREVEEEKVEAVAVDEPAPHGGRVGVDGAGGAVPERERRAGALALEEVVEEEPLRAEHGLEERDRRPMARPAPVGGEVDGSRAKARVGERLEEGDRAAAEMVAVHPDQRVPERASQTRRPGRAERRAVLDEPSLPAVPPDEVRDLVHVRVRPGGDRGEADRGERRECRRGAAERARLRERGQRRGRRRAEGRLEHGRGEPVDDDEDELAAHRDVTSRACAARHAARAPGARGAPRRRAPRPP